MAKRLSVFLSQTSAADSLTGEKESRLIAELLQAAGLDLSIVQALPQVQLESTDHLCLQAMGSEAVLLTWLPFSEVQIHWQRLGLTNHLHVLNARETQSGRSTYVQQLCTQMQAVDLVNELQMLRQRLSISTVSILLPGNQPVALPVSSRQKLSRESQADRTIEFPVTENLSGSFDSRGPDTTDAKSEDWLQLDSLVDELEDLDL
ncbi:MAG: hypothetical protein KDB03_06150 [Planctomycetales bacterium]|nr:hypothetical protein [Planctomycetales bacterium]